MSQPHTSKIVYRVVQERICPTHPEEVPTTLLIFTQEKAAEQYGRYCFKQQLKDIENCAISFMNAFEFTIHYEVLIEDENYVPYK